MKWIPYICIVVLFVIILLQSKSCHNEETVPTSTGSILTRIDTVILPLIVRDTIPGKPVFIKSKIDTSIWTKKRKNIPDTSYSGLLSQYKALGNSHFSTNV